VFPYRAAHISAVCRGCPAIWINALAEQDFDGLQIAIRSGRQSRVSANR